MADLLTAVSLGVATGLFLIAAGRAFWLGWFALAPLCAAVYLSPPPSAAAAGFVGVGLAVSSQLRGRFPFMPRSEIVLSLMAATTWALACGLAALIWPAGSPAWGVLVFPVTLIAVSAVAEQQSGRLGNGLLATQQSRPVVLQIARLGGDLTVSAALALTAAVTAVLLVRLPPSPATIAAGGAGLALVAVMLGYGAVALRRTRIRQARGGTMRVAAVSVDGDASDGPVTGPEYRDVPGTVARYEPHVRRALAEGARVVVLPEVAVTVTPEGRRLWLEALGRWAKDGAATVVSGLYQQDERRNQLVIADRHGAIAAVYDKQHPLRGAEAPRYQTMDPARVEAEVPVSGLICYDQDYSDVLRPVARTGGVLAVPSNDWRQIADEHNDAAAWAAVLAGVPVVRSTGHGVSAIFDATGAVLARASSFDGPAVVVADVPVAGAAGSVVGELGGVGEVDVAETPTAEIGATGEAGPAAPNAA